MKRKIKELNIIIYLIVFILSVAIFYLFTNKEDPMGYSLIFIYVIHPISLFVCNYMNGLRRKKSTIVFIYPLIYAILYMLLEYLTFSLANTIAFGNVNYPDFYLLLIGLIISYLGLGIGLLIRRKEYRVAKENDINEWMKLVRMVSASFPGLESEDKILEHQKTVMKFIKRGEAIYCIRQKEIIGIMLFSLKDNQICFLAVHPSFRRCGIASNLIEYALKKLDHNIDITLETFVESDQRGIEPRKLYTSFGFVPEEIKESSGCPSQVFRLYKK